MKQIFLPENNDFVNYITFQVDDYIIEMFPTIFGGRRIAIREFDDFGYICNWCAGSEIKDAEILLGLAKACIEQNIKVPFCSDPKPYFKDNKFMNFMKSVKFEPYNLKSK